MHKVFVFHFKLPAWIPEKIRDGIEVFWDATGLVISATVIVYTFFGICNLIKEEFLPKSVAIKIPTAIAMIEALGFPWYGWVIFIGSILFFLMFIHAIKKHREARGLRKRVNDFSFEISSPILESSRAMLELIKDVREKMDEHDTIKRFFSFAGTEKKVNEIFDKHNLILDDAIARIEKEKEKEK